MAPESLGLGVAGQRGLRELGHGLRDFGGPAQVVGQGGGRDLGEEPGGEGQLLVGDEGRVR